MVKLAGGNEQRGRVEIETCLSSKAGSPSSECLTVPTLSPHGPQPEREAKCHTHSKTSFIWEEFLIVKAASKFPSQE